MRQRAQLAIAADRRGRGAQRCCGGEGRRHNAAFAADDSRAASHGRACSGRGACISSRSRSMTPRRHARVIAAIDDRRAWRSPGATTVPLARFAAAPSRRDCGRRAHLAAGAQRPAEGLRLAEGAGLLSAGAAAAGRLALCRRHAGAIGRERRRRARLPRRLAAQLRRQVDPPRVRHGPAGGRRRQDLRDGRQGWRLGARRAHRRADLACGPGAASRKRERDAFGGGLAFANGKLYVASGYRAGRRARRRERPGGLDDAHRRARCTTRRQSRTAASTRSTSTTSC